jgi:hypothetical protein
LTPFGRSDEKLLIKLLWGCSALNRITRCVFRLFMIEIVPERVIADYKRGVQSEVVNRMMAAPQG